MATDTLTLPGIANQLSAHFERMKMLQELTRMTLEVLPHSTDSDVPGALLNGMAEILSVDTFKMFELSERVANLAGVSADVYTENSGVSNG